MKALGLALIAAPLLALAAPASAQVRYGDSIRHQFDRPGDYRCDAFWDRGRTDCDARWRDQRPFRTAYHGHDRSYGHGHSSYGRHSRQWNAYAQGGNAYYGAYGRPDLVYPGGGYSPSHGQGARDLGRIHWCQASYRSYDPRSGYYRAYSGRLVYCG